MKIPELISFMQFILRIYHSP